MSAERNGCVSLLVCKAQAQMERFLYAHRRARVRTAAPPIDGKPVRSYLPPAPHAGGPSPFLLPSLTLTLTLLPYAYPRGRRAAPASLEDVGCNVPPLVAEEL